MCSRFVSRPRRSHDWQPSWSPDGKHGGVQIGDATAAACSSFPRRAVTNGESRISAIGRNGRRAEPTILFSSSNTVRSKLYVAGADGRQLRQVLAPFLDEFASYRAAWHPDGHRISVFGSHRRDGMSFWTVSLDGTLACSIDW